MASNATGLGVVNLQSNLRSNLNALNVEKTTNVSYSMACVETDSLDVMPCCVYDREEEHSVSDLSVKPL